MPRNKIKSDFHLKAMDKKSFPGGFSVLMAVYFKDDPSIFFNSIRSVIENSILPNQFLIVIDGPLNEELENVLSKALLISPLIELLRLPSNVGLANALNAGLKRVKYPWVVRADADDINLPDRFYILAKEIRSNPKIDLLGSSILEVNKENKELAYRKPPENESEIRKYIKYRNPFNHMSVVYRLSKVLELGGYPNIFLKEDYALWAKFISNYAMVKNIPDVLVRVSAGDEMYKRRGGIDYVKSEIYLQKYLITLGLQSILGGLILGTFRSVVFLMPNNIRGLFYLTFLRERLDKEIL